MIVTLQIRVTWGLTIQGAAFFRCLLHCNAMETKLQTLMDLLILWDYIWLQKNIKKIWIQSVIIVDVRGPRIFSTVVAGLPVVRGFLPCKMHFDHVLMKLWRNRWNEIMEKICEMKQWRKSVKWNYGENLWNETMETYFHHHAVGAVWTFLRENFD